MSPYNPPYQKKDTLFFFLECYGLGSVCFLKPPYPLYGFIFRNQG